METATMTLTEFLLARIAEDEAVARRAHRAYQHVYGIPHYFTANSETSVAMSPPTALAECEAKRRIVDEYLEAVETYKYAIGGADSGLRSAVHILAAVYADHPDYREEWRP